MVTDVDAVTEPLAIVKPALVAPGCTVTLAGTAAIAVLLLEIVTTAPSGGAALVNVTVPCEELPPTTLVGLSVKVESAAGPGGACAVNLRVTDQGPATPAELMPRTRHHNLLGGSELVVKLDTATFWLTICGALNVLESSI